MTLVKDALAYRHFVFIDCTISRHTNTLEFKGSVCRINGEIYRLISKDDKLYFKVLSEEEILQDKIRLKHVMTLCPNEHIGLIIYNNRKNTHYEYIIPNEISDVLVVE